MPKVYLDPVQKQIDRVMDYICGESKRRNFNQKYMGEEVLHISQQAYGYKIRHRSLSLEDIIKIFDFFKTPAEKVGELLGYEKGWS